MTKLGVFYCLGNDLKSDVEELKLFFNSKCKISKYLNHLAHSTIYVFEIDPKKLNDVSKKFESLQKSMVPVSSTIKNWRVFENDILTSLNTLCLEIELTNNLKDLQMNVVKSLFQFHSKNKKLNFEGDLQFSNEKYGYPFVGNHWIPHITVGSLNLDSKKITKYAEGLFKFSREITINNLCLFKIDGDSHQLIKKIGF
tara:strand:+ start:341 stop:934 length:594 start_codon:yes stop_codon:yes gene_type:complete